MPARTSSSVPLGCRREDFQIPPDEHYLNCAYMGPLPRVAEEAGFEAIRRKRVPTRIAAPDDFWATDPLRALFARLIGSDEPERIAIHGMATLSAAALTKLAIIRSSRTDDIRMPRSRLNSHMDDGQPTRTMVTMISATAAIMNMTPP